MGPWVIKSSVNKLQMELWYLDPKYIFQRNFFLLKYCLVSLFFYKLNNCTLKKYILRKFGDYLHSFLVPLVFKKNLIIYIYYNSFRKYKKFTMKNLTDLIRCSTIVSENHLNLFNYCTTGFVRMTCDRNDEKMKFLILSQKKSFLNSNSVLKLIVIIKIFLIFCEHYYLLEHSNS